MVPSVVTSVSLDAEKPSWRQPHPKNIGGCQVPFRAKIWFLIRVHFPHLLGKWRVSPHAKTVFHSRRYFTETLMLALLEQLLPLTFLTLQSLLAVPQLAALAGCLSGFWLSYSSAPFPTCFACSFFIPQFIIAFLFPQTSGWHHDYHAHFFYTVYTIYTGCVHGFSPPPTPATSKRHGSLSLSAAWDLWGSNCGCVPQLHLLWFSACGHVFGTCAVYGAAVLRPFGELKLWCWNQQSHD